MGSQGSANVPRDHEPLHLGPGPLTEYLSGPGTKASMHNGTRETHNQFRWDQGANSENLAKLPEQMFALKKGYT